MNSSVVLSVKRTASLQLQSCHHHPVPYSASLTLFYTLIYSILFNLLRTQWPESCDQTYGEANHSNARLSSVEILT